MENIVLIGMMGCGKTTVGRILAGRLGLELADTDALAEALAGRTIPAIFEEAGEEAFRALEAQAAAALAARTGLVVACGGGLPLYPAAMEPLAAGGRVMFLNRDPAEIYRSVSMAGRPLGQGGEAAFLERFARREPVYRRWADHIITEFSSPAATAEAILEVLS